MEILDFIKNFGNLEDAQQIDLEKMAKMISAMSKSEDLKSNNNTLLKIDDNIKIAKLMFNLISDENNKDLQDFLTIVEITNFMNNYKNTYQIIDEHQRRELKNEALKHIRSNITDESNKIVDVAIKIFEVKNLMSEIK